MVQEEFNVEEQGNYIISVKNPETSSPPRMRRSRSQKAQYPDELTGKFHGKRFLPLDPVQFMNYKGTEFILIAASEDVKDDLGIDFQQEAENRCSADIFKDLKLDISTRLKKPLFRGKWE